MVRAYVSRTRSIAHWLHQTAFLSSLWRFFSLQLRPICVYGPRSVCVRICTEREQSAVLFHREVAALQADVARLCCRLLLSPCWLLCRSRIHLTLAEIITHHLISPSKIPAFSSPFSSSSSSLVSCRSWFWLSSLLGSNSDSLSLAQSRISCNDAS